MTEQQLRDLLAAIATRMQNLEYGDDAFNLAAHVVTVALRTLTAEPARSWVLRWKNGEAIPPGPPAPVSLLGEAIEDIEHARVALSHYGAANPDAQATIGPIHTELGTITDTLDTLYSDHHIALDAPEPDEQEQTANIRAE